MNIIDPSHKIPVSESVETQKVKSKNKEESKTEKTTKGMIKGHEAEDVRKDRPSLKRQTSVPDLKGKTADQAQEIEKKNGVLWDCIDRIPNKEGGYIYIFKLKKEYDALSNPDNPELSLNPEIYVEMFPAVENATEDMIELLPDSTKKKTAEKWNKFSEFLGPSQDSFEEKYQNRHMAELKKLGYQNHVDSDGVYIHLPDREALLANWEKLREKNKNLPPLSILSSEGVADDMSFVEAYFTHDFLLSTGGEFVHDQQAHILPTLLTIMHKSKEGPQAYSDFRGKLVKSIAKSYRQIHLTRSYLIEKQGKHPIEIPQRLQKHLNKIEGALGALVDTIAAPQPSVRIEHIPTIEEAWLQYNPLWQKRYGDELISDEEMAELLQDIQKVEQEFDKLYKKSTPAK